ncbi:MAG TPA: outer membrane protein assembly factor BamA, partial [Chryseobacterium sp.]|nr:outer membrane protein assembly factor BamA [Chryseobacterium sp.]
EYIKKGYADARVTIEDKVNAQDPELVDWTINVERGKKVKISHIEFEGNENVSDNKLRKKGFKDTKQKRFGIQGILKPSKFIEEKYEADKDNLINYYRSLGFRDAKIVSDSVWRNPKNDFEINVKLNEGKKYYIGDINFLGNTAFSTDYL